MPCHAICINAFATGLWRDYSGPNNSPCFEMCFCVCFGPNGFTRMGVFETVRNRDIITESVCSAAPVSHGRPVRSQGSYQYLVGEARGRCPPHGSEELP